MKIEVRNLSKSYESKKVLDTINLTFNPDNVYCIVGKNGVGKTTFFNLLLQMLEFNSGEVLYDDRTYENLPNEIKKKIGFSGDNSFLVNELTPFQFLTFTGKLYELSAAHITQRIKELFEYFFEDSSPLMKQSIATLSTGMKKKISICSAILHLPSCLILDEPFAGLDPVSAHQVISLLDDYKKSDRTIIISSHDLDYVAKLASHIIIFDKSKIVFEGSSIEIIESGKNLDEIILNLLNPPKTKKLSWL